MVTEKIYINNWSHQEWLQYRSNGIGGSEVGTIIGVNPYKSSAQLWLEKVGLYPTVHKDTIATFMGSYQEDTVADLWQYHDQDEEVFMKNYKAKTKTGKCRRLNAYIKNDKYPWLQGSIDRKIYEKEGQKVQGVLECKTINSYYASKFENGVPPSYMYQLQTYLLITGYSFGEIALLKDGRILDVLKMEADEKIQEDIVLLTKRFWDSVLAARPIAEEILKEEAKDVLDTDRLDELSKQLNALEPNCDTSKSYEDYMKERYKKPQGQRQGTAAELNLAQEYKKTQEKIGRLKTEQQYYKNALIEKIRDKEVILFDEGKVTFKTNARGSKSLRVTV